MNTETAKPFGRLARGERFMLGGVEWVRCQHGKFAMPVNLIGTGHVGWPIDTKKVVQVTGTRQYRVLIRRYTHTIYQRPVMQEQHEVLVTALIHRPKLAAIAAGCPKTARTQCTGWYTNEIEGYEMSKTNPGWTKRNWTEWHVIS